MDTEKKTHNLWDDYLVISLIVAVLMIIIGHQKDIFYQIIPVIVFMFITGIKENLTALLSFLKRWWPFSVSVVVYLVLFLIVSKDEESAMYILTVFFMVYAGNCMIKRSEGDMISSYGKLWTVMLVLILYGISKTIRDFNVGAFMNYSVELAATVVFFMIAVLFIDDKTCKILGIIISLISFVLLLRNGAFNVAKIMYIKGILPTYMEGGPRWLLFGRGHLALQMELPDLSENSFASFLFDYGLVALAFFLAVFIYAVFLALKTEDKLLKKQAILICTMIVISLTYSVEYWGNMMFLVFTGIGALFGRAEYVRENLKNSRL